MIGWCFSDHYSTENSMSPHERLSEGTAITAVGSGPAVLLAHGAGGGIDANFGPVLRSLAAAHRTLGVDYPGSGLVPPSTGPLMLDALADRLVGAADDEGIEEFAVAGFSLGGPVAIRVCARYPERVKAVILTATFARADTRLRLAAKIWSELYATGDRRLLAEFLTLVAFSDEALEAAGPSVLRESVDALAGAIAPGTREQLTLLQQTDVRADAAQIAAPTLVLVTSRDPLVSISTQRSLHAMIPGARIKELNSGHLPFAELPDQWSSEVLAFLEFVGWSDARDRAAAQADER